MWMEPARSELTRAKAHECAVLVLPRSWLRSTNKGRYWPLAWRSGQLAVSGLRGGHSIGGSREHQEVCARNLVVGVSLPEPPIAPTVDANRIPRFFGFALLCYSTRGPSEPRVRSRNSFGLLHWMIGTSPGSGPRSDWRKGLRGAAPKRHDQGKVDHAHGSRWEANSFAERDNGEILECCVDDQCFVRGLGILGEKQARGLNTRHSSF